MTRLHDQPLTTPHAEKPTALIVDDEPIIRYVLRAHLEDLGFDVLAAGRAESALEIYRDSGSRIDLILLDLHLPAMTGRQCFVALKQLDSRARIIITTGSTLDEDREQWLRDGAVGFINKPFNLDDVTALVNQVLDEECSPA